MSARGEGIAYPYFNTASSLVTKNEGGFIMRKNLKSKVLLTLLAASVFYLPAYANAAETLEITADTPLDSTWFHVDGFYDVNYDSYVNAVYHAKSLTDNTITVEG